MGSSVNTQASKLFCEIFGRMNVNLRQKKSNRLIESACIWEIFPYCWTSFLRSTFFQKSHLLLSPVFNRNQKSQRWIISWYCIINGVSTSLTIKTLHISNLISDPKHSYKSLNILLLSSEHSKNYEKWYSKHPWHKVRLTLP